MRHSKPSEPSGRWTWGKRRGSQGVTRVAPGSGGAAGRHLRSTHAVITSERNSQGVVAARLTPSRAHVTSLGLSWGGLPAAYPGPLAGPLVDQRLLYDGEVRSSGALMAAHFPFTLPHWAARGQHDRRTVPHWPLKMHCHIVAQLVHPFARLCPEWAPKPIETGVWRQN